MIHGISQLHTIWLTSDRSPDPPEQAVAKPKNVIMKYLTMQEAMGSRECLKFPG